MNPYEVHFLSPYLILRPIPAAIYQEEKVSEKKISCTRFRGKGKRFWCLKVCILGVQFISSIHFALSSSPEGYFYLFINTNLSLHYLSRRNAFSVFYFPPCKTIFSLFPLSTDQIIYLNKNLNQKISTSILIHRFPLEWILIYFEIITRSILDWCHFLNSIRQSRCDRAIQNRIQTFTQISKSFTSSKKCQVPVDPVCVNNEAKNPWNRTTGILPLKNGSIS